MHFRAPWLVLGCVVASAACGLSTVGLSPDPGEADEAGSGLDATSSGEGAAPGSDDAAGDATRGHDDATPSRDDASGDDATSADDADGGAPADAAHDGSPHPSDGGEGGDASDAGEATGADAGDAGTQPGDAGCTGSGCVTVPPGWSLVAFAPNQTTACPTGFETPSNLVEGPDATGACTCGACSLTGQPSCASGEVGVFYDTIATGGGAGTCGLPAVTPYLTNNPAGACGNAADGGVYAGSYTLFDLEYIPPPASGGACSAPGAATGSVTYSAHDRACVPVSAQSAGCVGNSCEPALSAPYAACVMQSGTVACPPGPLSQRHLAGAGVSFGCSACGCGVSATCTGTITLYTDARCKNQGVQVPANGTCNRIVSRPDSANTYTFDSYTYAANPPASVACAATGSSSAQSVALAGPVTICCAP